MKMKTGIIMQARLGSTRLPEKMILKLNSQTVIEFLLERLQFTELVDQVIVATTLDDKDDRLEKFVRKLGFPVYRGRTWNVLDRFYQAALTYDVDILVRICGDNPFLEPAEISRLISILESQQYDYVANSLPDGTHLILTGTGMAVEVFTFDALEKVMRKNLDRYHQEHVTPYFYEHPDEFSVHLSPVPYAIKKDVRLTVDLPEDYSNVKRIYRALHPDITIGRILGYLDRHPQMLRSMNDIAQRQQKGRTE